MPVGYKISQKLKERIFRAFDSDEASNKELACEFGLSVTTLTELKREWKEIKKIEKSRR